jgi:hypothetical protein
MQHLRSAANGGKNLGHSRVQSAAFKGELVLTSLFEADPLRE